MITRKKVHIGMLLLVVGLLTACIPINWMPEEGVWYCKELQLQLSFEADVDSYVIVNGERKRCSVRNEQYSRKLYVRPFKEGSKFVDYDVLVFSGEWAGLDDEELVLRTEDGQKMDRSMPL